MGENEIIFGKQFLTLIKGMSKHLRWNTMARQVGWLVDRITLCYLKKRLNIPNIPDEKVMRIPG